MIKVGLNGVFKALDKINNKISKMEDIATTRTLNIILEQQRREISSDVAEEYGMLKSSVKKHITPVKATRVNKEIKLIASSSRTKLPSPRKISGGISFRKKGGGRGKIKSKISPGSSKPFVIRVKAGGVSGGDDIKVRGGVKKVAVFVPKLFNKFTDIRQRKVKTLLGPTIAKMIGDMEIKSKELRKAINEKFPKIYKKQLEKANNTGRF